MCSVVFVEFCVGSGLREVKPGVWVCVGVCVLVYV